MGTIHRFVVRAGLVFLAIGPVSLLRADDSAREPTEGVATGGGVRVRASAGLNGRIVGALSPNRKLLLIGSVRLNGESQPWREIVQPPDLRGWVYGGYVRPVEGREEAPLMLGVVDRGAVLPLFRFSVGAWAVADPFYDGQKTPDRKAAREFLGYGVDCSGADVTSPKKSSSRSRPALPPETLWKVVDGGRPPRVAGQGAVAGRFLSPGFPMIGFALAPVYPPEKTPSSDDCVLAVDRLSAPVSGVELVTEGDPLYSAAVGSVHAPMRVPDFLDKLLVRVDRVKARLRRVPPRESASLTCGVLKSGRPLGGKDYYDVSCLEVEGSARIRSRFLLSSATGGSFQVLDKSGPSPEGGDAEVIRSTLGFASVEGAVFVVTSVSGSDGSQFCIAPVSAPGKTTCVRASKT